MMNNPLNRPGNIMREICKGIKDSENDQFYRGRAEWWKNFAMDTLGHLADSEIALQRFRGKVAGYTDCLDKMNRFSSELVIRKDEIERLKARIELMENEENMQLRRKKEQVARLLKKLRYYLQRKQKRSREYKAQLAAGTRTRKKKGAPPVEASFPLDCQPGEPGEPAEEGGDDAAV